MPKKKVTEEITNKEEKKVDLTKIKEDLTSYIDTKMNDKLFQKIDNLNKIIIRQKNKKILSQKIVITLLLLVIVLLLYVMNDQGYFYKYSREYYEETSERVKKDREEEPNEEAPQTGPSLEELSEKYTPLLNKIYIKESSPYFEDYHTGNLTTELKLYLALNNADFKKITTEDDYSEIPLEIIKTAYQKLFTDEFNHANFIYQDKRLRYINKLDAYLLEGEITKEELTNKRTIADIKENGKEVVITTDELYIIDEEERWFKLSYTFKDNKLISIKEVSE